MRKFFATLVVVGLIGCNDSPSGPDGVPVAAFSKGGQGNGTTFLLSSEDGGIFGWTTLDRDGDRCSVSLFRSDQPPYEHEFDANDFTKISPDGQTVEFSRGEVEIFFTEASGAFWYGTGHGHLKSAGGKWNSLATGRLTDPFVVGGGPPKTAICKWVDSSNGSNIDNRFTN